MSTYFQPRVINGRLIVKDANDAIVDLGPLVAPNVAPTDTQTLAWSNTLGQYTPVNPTGSSVLAYAENVSGTPTVLPAPPTGGGFSTSTNIPGLSIVVPPSGGRPVKLEMGANFFQVVTGDGSCFFGPYEGTTNLSSALVRLPNSTSVPLSYGTMFFQFNIGVVSTSRTFTVGALLYTATGGGVPQISFMNASNNPSFIRAVAG